MNLIENNLQTFVTIPAYFAKHSMIFCRNLEVSAAKADLVKSFPTSIYYLLFASNNRLRYEAGARTAQEGKTQRYAVDRAT